MTINPVDLSKSFQLEVYVRAFERADLLTRINYVTQIMILWEGQAEMFEILFPNNAATPRLKQAAIALSGIKCSGTDAIEKFRSMLVEAMQCEEMIKQIMKSEEGKPWA
jgi:hypothetical protein